MKSEMASVLRTDFLAFARMAIYENEGTKVSRDHYLEVIASKLMDFADGKTKRILVNLPPRHLKTQLGSVCLAAWVLAHKPNTKIMVVAYSEELAEQIARSIRSILQADWFKKIFETRIAKGHAKTKNFGTNAGGALYAASIDGSVTGFGADVIIVDDPHNIADAGYPEQLERTIERFDTIIMSRLNNRKKGRVIVIAHRIHDNDLSAHLLASGGWTHVVLPVIATRDQTYHTAYGPWHRHKGTLLQPDADDLDEVEKLRAKLVNPSFDLLYQQDADGQALPSIAAKHFPSYRSDNLRKLPHVISIDAGTDKGDTLSFSVILVVAYDGDKYYIVDEYRARCDYHELGRMVRRFGKRYRQSPILIERAANGPALLSELTRRQRKRVYGITPRRSKAARFRPHLDKILAGRVQLLLDEPFRSYFVQEFVEFPHGRHTDQVDAFSQAMAWIDDQGSLDPSQTAVATPGYCAAGHNSQFTGFDRRNQPKPNEPGIMAASCNSYRAPNAPFPTFKAWVRY
jgi:predicted phage terminase large subunit-like protein